MKTYVIDDAGFVADTQFIASPNYDERPTLANGLSSENLTFKNSTLQNSAPVDICLIVVHNISLPPSQYGGNGIIELFTNQLNPDEHPYYAEIYTRKVSSHFLIRRDGELIQFVSCLKRAWHAGVSKWQSRERCNDFSVGIELEGSDFDAFEAKQYLTLMSLIASLRNRYPIQDIVGHSEIAPGRKTDPGPFFDWSEIKSANH